MTLAVVGLGLVSALGSTPCDHAFFARAGAVRPRPSPFRDASGEPIPVLRVPWLDVRTPFAARLTAIAAEATSSAVEPLAGAPLPRGAPLFVCLPGARPGLDAAALDAVAQRLGAELRTSEVERRAGAAGVFAALGEGMARIAQGRAELFGVVAVDSWLDRAALASWLSRQQGPWSGPVPPPGEGAAAFLVTSPERARRSGWPVFGTILGSASEKGASSDEDDELVDGTAMTRVLRALPPGEPARAAYGQLSVDDLRFDEWSFAIARTSPRVAADHEAVTLEQDTGATGAAAGAMALSYGLAASRHGTARRTTTHGAPFLAWAISRDGARGAALAQGAADE